MVKKKINIWYLVILLIIIILIIGIYKAINEHQEKEYLVVNNKILESAKECYLKGDCEGEITLKYLYEKEYLVVQVDPVTKENINEDMCITFKEDTAVFC